MSRLHFGTDGVRGPYGGPLVNEAFFARLAAAAGRWVWAQPDFNRTQRDGLRAPESLKVLIGRDTRASGLSLMLAVAAGLRASGLEPVDLGVLPTPALAWAVKTTGAALGVVITASHNPAEDNGIKFFARGGLKLSDADESCIEGMITDGMVPASMELGEVAPGGADQYLAALVRRYPPEAFKGWHLVLDTANGATRSTSAIVLRSLGAEVVGIGAADYNSNRRALEDAVNSSRFNELSSQGKESRRASLEANLAQSRINAGVGSEHPEKMAALVRTSGARLGIAHDGDGDRCVLCDEHGDILDGDEILTLLAVDALRQGRLAADTLVVTVQSNLGVDAALAAAGGCVVRTPVGDRYVAERMRSEGATLGGESSGHIICSDISPTGDGLVAALRVMEVMRATGRPLSELRRVLVKFPQRSATLTARDKPPLASLTTLTAAILSLEAELGARGRVLVRWSGTEPKLRLLVEGPEDAIVRSGLADLLAAAKADLGLSGES